jgi:hypothetical protein
MSRELLQQALELLEVADQPEGYVPDFHDTIKAIRAHLAAQPAPVPADLTMTRDELVAAAESIGMQWPAPVPVPLTDGQFNSVLAALLIARRYVLTNPEQLASIAYAINIVKAAHGIGIAASPEKKP